MDCIGTPGNEWRPPTGGNPPHRRTRHLRPPPHPPVASISSSNARQYTLAQCVRLAFARKVLGASVRYCHSQVSRRTYRMRDGSSRPAALSRRRGSEHVARTVTSACARRSPSAIRAVSTPVARVTTCASARQGAAGSARSPTSGAPVAAAHTAVPSPPGTVVRQNVTPGAPRGHLSDWTAAARCHGGGTRTDAMPAAVAAWMPNSVSSKTRQWAGATPSRSAAIRNASGWGLPCV